MTPGGQPHGFHCAGPPEETVHDPQEGPLPYFFFVAEITDEPHAVGAEPVRDEDTKVADIFIREEVKKEIGDNSIKQNAVRQVSLPAMNESYLLRRYAGQSFGSQLQHLG